MMRKIFPMVLLFGLTLTSCIEFYDGGDPVMPLPKRNYEAVNYARADLDSSIQLMPPQEIVTSGKIYIINNLLFINEKRKGFHVFDNSDQSNPVKINFIQTLGATDLAVRNEVLYINQATDLITLQYFPKANKLKLMKRIKNAFPEIRSPQGYKAHTPQDSLTVGWTKIN